MPSTTTPSTDPALKIRKAKVCYLCGLPGADTTEHVLSRCLYPDPNKLPNNVLTLPAHLKCNKQTSKDEEAFRDLISPSLASDKVGRALWERTWRGIHRPAATRYRAAYYQRIITRFDLDHNNKLVRVPLATTLEAERVHWVLGKLVKGLFTAMTGELMPNSSVCWEFDQFRAEKEAKEESSCLPESKVFHDVLSVRWGRAFDEPLATIWVLGFYSTQYFWVATTPEYRQEPGDGVRQPSRMVWPISSVTAETLPR